MSFDALMRMALLSLPHVYLTSHKVVLKTTIAAFLALISTEGRRPRIPRRDAWRGIQGIQAGYSVGSQK